VWAASSAPVLPVNKKGKLLLTQAGPPLSCSEPQALCTSLSVCGCEDFGVEYVLKLSRRQSLMKFSRADSRVTIFIKSDVSETVGRDSSAGIATGYGMDGSVIAPRWGAKFSATGPGAHPASYTMGTGFLSRGSSGRGVVLSIHLYLAPRLRKE
jgi:hypothetical protein